MSAIEVLPTVNAMLNATAATLLVAGFVLIRRRRVRAHHATMLAAFGVSVLFLISYVTYHAAAGSRPFTGEGAIRSMYFTLLVSHIVLAALVVPLALVTLVLGWRGRLARHRGVARVTLPIWLYVSLTGVVVYWMLYHR